MGRWEHRGGWSRSALTDPLESTDPSSSLAWGAGTDPPAPRWGAAAAPGAPGLLLPAGEGGPGNATASVSGMIAIDGQVGGKEAENARNVAVTPAPGVSQQWHSLTTQAVGAGS